MARYEHLQIYKAAIDLAVYIEQIVASFSHYHKYTLGTELRTLSHKIVVLIIKVNNMTDKRVIIWTYYPNGDVNVITVNLLDANNNVMSTQTIQHYQNGQQPTSVIT